MPPETMNWSEPPDYHEVRAVYEALAATRAKIVKLRRAIRKKEAELKEQFPRNPAKREQIIAALLDDLAELEATEARYEVTIRFYELWRDLYRAQSFTRVV